MPRQKFRRLHPPAAFALQFQNPQRILAAGDDDAGFVRRQNFRGFAGVFNNFRLPDFQQLRFGVPSTDSAVREAGKFTPSWCSAFRKM